MMADKKKHRANEVYFAENTNITIFWKYITAEFLPYKPVKINISGFCPIILKLQEINSIKKLKMRFKWNVLKNVLKQRINEAKE